MAPNLATMSPAAAVTVTPWRRRILGMVTFLLLSGFIPATYANEHGAYGVASKVLYAINAGSYRLTVDSDGIEYAPDPYMGMGSKVGVDSDYGRRFLTIGRTETPDDAYLYQTERYGLSTFGYEIPVKDDGDYVLVLKFCEVYFLNPRKKVFDVQFNGHVVVKNLDIYAKVGHITAHDEIIPFKITDKGKVLQVGGEKSAILKGRVPLTFVKGPHDNPKINAFYVIRGNVEDVPQLPPLDRENPYEEYDDEDEELFEPTGPGQGYFDEVDEEEWNPDELNFLDEQEEKEPQTLRSPSRRRRRSPSLPAVQHRHDPYADEDTWSWNNILPIGGALGACVITFLVVKYIVGKPG